VSGAKDSRPELNSAEFDVVFVWKLDRFGRSLRHLVNALAAFESLNIAFVSLSDNLDLSTASGRLMFQIIGSEWPSLSASESGSRVKAGMKNAKSEGTRITASQHGRIGNTSPAFPGAFVAGNRHKAEG
jgi:DNA invertase Pin-like site-specific DNA recombinase